VQASIPGIAAFIPFRDVTFKDVRVARPLHLDAAAFVVPQRPCGRENSSHQHKSDALGVHYYLPSVSRDCCECHDSSCGRTSIGSGLPQIPWPVLSQQEQTGYIILAIALVALLWFLTAFVRAMLIILINGGLSLF
jgi:hypothetical protein